MLGLLLQGLLNGLCLLHIALLHDLAQGIAQRHGQIAQPTHVANATNGAAFGAPQKRGFIPLPQLQQRGAAPIVALIKIGQMATTGKLVPGACQLAIVAAVNAVADQGAQLGRNRAVMLDREVGNTPPRIQPIWCNDGLRRAGRDAGRALPAVTVVRERRRHRQRQVGKNFSQKKGRTRFAIQQQGVFAAPTLRAAASQFGLQHRSRIGKHAVAHAAHMLLDATGQLLQAGAHDLVVIAPPGIDRHHRFARLQQALLLALAPIGRRGGGQIVHARSYHPHRARYQLGRPGAFQPMRRHVVHIAMKALRQPRQQPRLGAAQVHIGHADAAKAQCRGLLPNRGQ